MRPTFSVICMLAVATLVALPELSSNAEERRTGLQWPARDLRTVGIENPTNPPWLSSAMAATETGIVARQIRIPARQALPIKASWSNGRLVAEIDGESRVIAVHIKRIYGGDQSKIQNPFSVMSAEEIHSLWGLVIDVWSEEMTQQVSEVDPRNVLITIKQDWYEQTTNPLPPLPIDL